MENRVVLSSSFQKALTIGGLQMNRNTEIGTELKTLGRGRELGWKDAGLLVHQGEAHTDC